MNELCINALYHSFYGETDELWHHGILGMKWGIRRYQPYGQGYDAEHKGRFLGKLFSKGKTTAKGISDYWRSGGAARDLGEGFKEIGKKAKGFADRKGITDTVSQLGSFGKEVGRRGKAGISRIGKSASSAASDLYRGIKGSGTITQSLSYLVGEGKKKVDAGSKFIDSVRLGARRQLSDVNQQFNGITPKQALQQAIAGIGAIGREGRISLGSINQGGKKSSIPNLDTIRTSVLGNEIESYRKSKKAFTPSAESRSLLGQLRGINEAASNRSKKREERESTLRGELADRDEGRIRDAAAEIADYRDPKQRKNFDTGAYTMSKYASSLLSQLGDINQSKKASSIGTSSTSGRSALISQLSGIDQTKKLSDIGWFDWDSQSSKKKSSGGYSMGSGGGFKISF